MGFNQPSVKLGQVPLHSSNLSEHKAQREVDYLLTTGKYVDPKEKHLSPYFIIQAETNVYIHPLNIMDKDRRTKLSTTF